MPLHYEINYLIAQPSFIFRFQMVPDTEYELTVDELIVPRKFIYKAHLYSNVFANTNFNFVLYKNLAYSSFLQKRNITKIQTI